MSGKHGRRNWFLILPIMLLAATAARAEQRSNYTVTGPIGAALWGLGTEPGTEALAYGFTHVTPVPPEASVEQAGDEPELPAPGPRLAFSVTRWAFEKGQWVRRQWYGDVSLVNKRLAIAGDLSIGNLDATVTGTMVEMTMEGVQVYQNVPGRLQVKWTAMGRTANTTLAYTYQTPVFAATLQTAGSGRSSQATGTITVAGLGGPIEIWGFGTLSAVKTGLLSVTQADTDSLP
jgi:hypothetical protein